MDRTSLKEDWGVPSCPYQTLNPSPLWMIPMEAAEDEPRNIYGNARNDEMILTFHIFSLYHIWKYNISIIHPLFASDWWRAVFCLHSQYCLESATIRRDGLWFSPPCLFAPVCCHLLLETVGMDGTKGTPELQSIAVTEQSATVEVCSASNSLLHVIFVVTSSRAATSTVER